MYLSYQQVTVNNQIKTVNELVVPAKATHCEIQASTNNVRYTMDGTTNPSTTAGMALLTTHEPKLFTIDDIRRIKFTRESSDGYLNLHYLAGRDI